MEPNQKEAVKSEFSKLMHELVFNNQKLRRSGEFEKFFSLCPQDITILELIGKKEKLTAKEISRLLLIPKTTAVTAVNRLVKRGYAGRVQNERDRREYFLVLTEEGRRINDEHERYETAFLELLCGMWRKEYYQELLEVLYHRGEDAHDTEL